jgi:geranylgeranyl diphosphate synthase type I
MSPCPAVTEPVARSRAAETEEFGRLLEGFQARVDREIAAFLTAKHVAAAGGTSAGAMPDTADTADTADIGAADPLGNRRSELSDPADLVDGIASLMAQGGKRLRPALVYFTYRACGGRAEEQVLPLALSTELLHTYLLFHDDIMDHAETRRGQPAAHVRFAGLHRAGGLRGDAGDFGRSAALLLGDLAHTYAVELFLRAVSPSAGNLPGAPARVDPPADLPGMPARVDPPADLPGMPAREDTPADLPALMRCFSEMSEEVIGGQYLEFLLAHRSPAAVSAGPSASSPQEGELMRILRLKSGRYTAERPIQLGALLAGASAAARAELSRYGMAVGEAFQLQDDLLGVFGDPATTGKPVGDDLREGKHTLLIHHALLALTPLAGAEDRGFLLGALGNSALSAAEIERAQSILEDTGARRAVSTMITERLTTARRALDTLSALDPRTSRRDEPDDGSLFLAGLLEYLRERNQ